MRDYPFEPVPKPADLAKHNRHPRVSTQPKATPPGQLCARRPVRCALARWSACPSAAGYQPGHGSDPHMQRPAHARRLGLAAATHLVLGRLLFLLPIVRRAAGRGQVGGGFGEGEGGAASAGRRGRGGRCHQLIRATSSLAVGGAVSVLPPPPGTLRSRSDPPQPERRGGQQIETPSPTAAAAATSCRPPPPPDASLCCAGQRARYSVCSCWECRCERNSARSLAATRRQRATSGPATAWELRHGNCGTQWKQRGA